MKVFLILVMMFGVVVGNEVKVRPGGTLMIDVTGVSAAEKGRLDNLYSVSKEGTLTMWKIGKIQAAGKTRSVLAKEIGDAYRKLGIYEKAVFQVRTDYDLTKVKSQKVLLQKRDAIEVTDALLKEIMPPKKKRKDNEPK